MKVGAKVQVFNYRMRERRAELKLSQKELGKLTGSRQAKISEIEILKPLKQSPEIAHTLHAIAIELNCDFDYLFPEEYLRTVFSDSYKPINNIILVKEISLESLSPGTTPADRFLPQTVEDKAFGSVLKEKIEELLDDLPTYEGYVLMLRHGLLDEEKHTLDECAKILGVTRERIRQVEQQAYSRLRHPRIAREIRDWLR